MNPHFYGAWKRDCVFQCPSLPGFIPPAGMKRTGFGLHVRKIWFSQSVTGQLNSPVNRYLKYMKLARPGEPPDTLCGFIMKIREADVFYRGLTGAAKRSGAGRQVPYSRGPAGCGARGEYF